MSFPLPFCNTRWLENVSLALRAIDLYDALKQYVKCVKSGKLKDPKTKSFDMHEWVKDPMYICTLNFFYYTATPIEKFLTEYQSDKPLIMFVANESLYIAPIT